MFDVHSFIFISKSNKARLRKIDNVLREHFGHKLKFDSETSDSEDDDRGNEALKQRTLMILRILLLMMEGAATR
jgi:hypothetical protein